MTTELLDGVRMLENFKWVKLGARTPKVTSFRTSRLNSIIPGWKFGIVKMLEKIYLELKGLVYMKFGEDWSPLTHLIQKRVSVKAI